MKGIIPINSIEFPIGATKQFPMCDKMIIVKIHGLQPPSIDLKNDSTA